LTYLYTIKISFREKLLFLAANVGVKCGLFTATFFIDLLLFLAQYLAGGNFFILPLLIVTLLKFSGNSPNYPVQELSAQQSQTNRGA
jgi:hypothetical protein